MSLKVPRGFKTFSEDAIIETNAGLRRKFEHQNRLAQRAQNDRASVSFLGKFVAGSAVFVVLCAVARPAYHFLQTFL